MREGKKKKKRWWRSGPSCVGRGSKENSSLLVEVEEGAPAMSLSVPQNGVKADNEPVIELFVKVRPQYRSHGRSFAF